MAPDERSRAARSGPRGAGSHPIFQFVWLEKMGRPFHIPVVKRRVTSDFVLMWHKRATGTRSVGCLVKNVKPVGLRRRVVLPAPLCAAVTLLWCNGGSFRDYG